MEHKSSDWFPVSVLWNAAKEGKLIVGSYRVPAGEVILSMSPVIIPHLLGTHFLVYNSSMQVPCRKQLEYSYDDILSPL